MEMMSDIDVRFRRTPFIYRIGKEFVTQKEALEFLMDPDIGGLDKESEWFEGGEMSSDVKTRTTSNGKISEATTNNTKANWNNILTVMSGPFSTRANQTDTSLGGNDAINNLYGFNEDDDIIPKILALYGNPNNGGMGLVYSEIYNSTQTLLHMTFGVPFYNNMAKFYGNAMDKGTADYVNTGSRSAGFNIGRFLGSVALAGLAIAFMPAIVPATYLVYKVVSTTAKALRTETITKYYEIRCTMPMYYRYVNTLLITLATNMNLKPNREGGSTATTSGSQSNLEVGTILTETQKSLDLKKQADIPIFDGSYSIYDILAKRDRRPHPSMSGTAQGTILNTDYMSSNLNEPEQWETDQQEDSNWGDSSSPFKFFAGFLPRASATMHGADKFISFRINKNVDASESISSSTGESIVASFLNNIGSAAKSMKDATMNNQISDGALGVIGDAVSGVVSGAVGAVAGLTGAGETMAAAITGAGLFDIPEIWKGSTFNKSHSFNLTFRSPYGDPISIWQSVYVPTMMIMAGALPRSIGVNAYTSPFNVRAYVVGRVAVPNGIIENLTVNRGAPEFGWSRSNLPLKINVSFSIKDLSPVMHMSMTTGSPGEILDILLGANSNMNEYLMTLSALGLQERLLWSVNFKRRVDLLGNLMRSTYGNSNFWATGIGNSAVGQIIGAISPYTRYGE